MFHWGNDRVYTSGDNEPNPGNIIIDLQQFKNTYLKNMDYLSWQNQVGSGLFCMILEL